MSGRNSKRNMLRAVINSGSKEACSSPLQTTLQLHLLFLRIPASGASVHEQELALAQRTPRAMWNVHVIRWEGHSRCTLCGFGISIMVNDGVVFDVRVVEHAHRGAGVPV